jgi:hypothetical protein
MSALAKLVEELAGSVTIAIEGGISALAKRDDVELEHIELQRMGSDPMSRFDTHILCHGVIAFTVRLVIESDELGRATKARVTRELGPWWEGKSR